MDLTPLYELRDRLRAGAIAGANLIEEDFRLRRALEALAPLEGASPVFARLGALTKALLAPDCPDRAGSLLEALTLADAVLCTQGASSVSGEVKPLPLRPQGDGAVVNAPYSALAPLLDALSTSGGGHYSLVLEAHENSPAFFQDYRVKAALVRALGASYAELADKVEEWLSQEDETVLPLLQRDFDPRGKREMVRRVRVMEAVAGAGANAFYLAHLDNAEKDVRAALIYALRLEESNVEKLVELCKTEKGACKKAAHWALVALQSPIAWAYWDAMMKKKPDQAAPYMVYSTAPQAEAFVARALLEAIAPFEENPAAPITKAAAGRLQSFLYALPGKSGGEICEFYRRAARLGRALDRPVEGEKAVVTFREDPDSYSCNMQFSDFIPRALCRALAFHSSPALCGLAEELAERGDSAYGAPRLVAALLSRSAGEAADVAESLNGQTVFHEIKDGLSAIFQKRGSPALHVALLNLVWDPASGKHVFRTFYQNPVTGGTQRPVLQPAREPLDWRVYTALMKAGNMDNILIQMMNRKDKEQRQRLGEYFYQKGLRGKEPQRMLQYLDLCGWEKCDGLLESCCRQNELRSVWSIRNFIMKMPGGPKAQLAEAERVLDLMEKGRLKTKGISLSDMRNLVASLLEEQPYK